MTKLEAGPSSLWICSSKPELAHLERHAHQLKVGNDEASQLLGATRINPGYHTLSARSDLPPALEETPNQGSDGLHRPGRDLECHGGMHGMAQRVDCTSTRLPLLLSNLPFQARIRLATLSTSGCIATLGSLPGERGTPRYVHGKEATAQPSNSKVRFVCLASQRMGNARLLTKFATRAWP
jgi:hypothetical protein